MTTPRSIKPAQWVHVGILALALGTGSMAVAQTTTGSGEPNFWQAGQGEGWGARLGYHDDYRRLGLVYETAPLWSHQSSGEWGRVTLTAELGVAYWDAQHGHPDSLWQVSATPMLRWWPNEFFYTEIGVGVNALSRTSFADKRLGSAFQFGNHIGVGALIADAHRIGLRYSHFSNAGIKKPNDGLDVLELTYTYQF